VFEAHLGASVPLSRRSFPGARTPIRNGAPDGRYRTAVAFVVLLASFSLGIIWTLGADPAVLIEGENEGLRAELVELRQVPVDEFVSLNDGSEYRWVLGPGFAPPESDGTWVRSRTAQLIFYLPDIGEADEGALSLELSVSPLLTGNQESRLLVVRSSAEEVEVELESEGARVFVKLAPGEQQVVELVCDSLDSPAEEALSIDMRRLCVKVYAMAVRKELR
jgi:hypothetical protein